MHLDTPFNMIIVGMTGCGKTYYLLTLLETEYEKHFENILVICPTFVQNRTYREWKYVNDECFFAIPCDHERSNEPRRRNKQLDRTRRLRELEVR